MDQNSNYITFEMNVRLQMKDYRIVLGLKRTWLVVAIVAATQIAIWYLKGKAS